MDNAIDWGRLGRAVNHYVCLGYTYVEVPWIVPRAITSITCPWHRYIMPVPGHGDLVGSAEQSFLALDSEGCLPKGRYVACTPCFRDEVGNDPLHQKTFMKVELYRSDCVDDAALEALIADASGFLIQETSVIARIHTEEGWDLMVNGIEVGSYGIRRHGNLAWVYGTGLAEPRFSMASRIFQGECLRP